MSIFMKNGKELVSKVLARDNLKSSIKKAVNLIGGFTKFVEKGDTIFVKPNFNTNDTYPGSSDLEFVRAVIELLYDAGAKKVVLAESSCFHTNSRKMMAHMLPVAQKARADVVILDEINDWQPVDVKGRYMKRFNVSKTYLDAKKTVWLPCMKTHRQAKFTLSLKLPIGMVRGTDRMKMHLYNLERKIADMNLAVPAPGLIIMDARKCFITGGPEKGTAREPNLIMASGDRVAIDVEAVKVIQQFPGNNIWKKSPWEFKQIKTAVENGIGNVKSEKDYSVLFADTIKR
jgi:uncharacterized protein (DUF362 family)